MRTDQSIINRYTVTAGVLSYSVTFPLYERSDVAVYLGRHDGSESLLVLDADYSVSINDNHTGGTVVLFDNVAEVGDVLALLSAVPYTQELDLSNVATIDVEATERQMDRTTQQIQQLKEQVERSVLIPPTSSGSPEDLIRDLFNARAESVSAAAEARQAEQDVKAWPGRAEVLATGSTTPRTLQDRFADVVNVRDYGAVGDGVTDDTAAIQAAFVYAKGRGPVKVVFPAGTYHLGTAGVAMCSDVTVDARAAHFTRALTVGGFFTNALGITASVGGYDGNSNIEWIGGTFHGNGSANSKQFQFFSFGHARNIRVADCVFYDRCGGGHSIEVTSISGLVIENCQFLGYSQASTAGTAYQKEAIQLEHSTPNGSWMGAPDYTPTTHVRVSGCRFAPNPLSGLGADEVAIGGHGAIQTTDGKANVSDVVVEDCYFEGCTYAAIRPYCAERFAVSNCTFVNCHRVMKLSGVPKASVITQSGAAATKGMACKSVSFVGNRVEVTKANTGLWVIEATDTFAADDTAAHEGLYIASNVCKKGAVDTDSTTRSICKLYRCRDVNISGNSFDYAAENGIDVKNQSAEVHITNNVFTKIGNKGVLTPDNSGVVGLYIEGNKLANDTYRGYSFAAVQLRGVSKFTIVRNDIESKLPASKTQSYTLNIDSNNNGYIGENSIVSENTNIQDIQVTGSNTDIKIGKNYFPKTNNAEPVNFSNGSNKSKVYSGSFILVKEDSAPAGIIFRNCGFGKPPALAGVLDSVNGYISLGVASLDGTEYYSVCGAHVSKDGYLPSFRPNGDTTARLGAGNVRWSELYAATAVINTSDVREKTAISAPNEALMRAWGKVGFKSFQFTDSVEKKGENARIHFGVIAQQVAEAFASEGLDASRYALFCYDRWEDEYEDVEVVDVEAVLDENGNEVTPTVMHTEKRLVTPAGDRYGIRYSEALALECAYQRWRLDKLEAKLNG